MARQMESLDGLVRKFGAKRFIEAAKGYTCHIRPTAEATIREMESRWYDSKHTISEANKMLYDYNHGWTELN